MSQPQVPSLAYTQEQQIPQTPLTPGRTREATEPIPLRPWFWVPFFVFLVLTAIGLEIALHFSNLYSGFPINSRISATRGVFHYLITLPPSFVAMTIVAMWAMTDIEIKRLQPYVDLAHESSDPERSLLMDYTRKSKSVAWIYAWQNGHTLIAITSALVIMCIALQPLASALLDVRDTFWEPQDFFIVNNLAKVGLNKNAQFTDLTDFVTAAGYASSAILYNLTDPRFIFNGWTVGPFDMPSFIGRNGSFSVAVPAILSNPGCVAAQPIRLVTLPGEAGWNATVINEDCSVSWSINRNATNAFGTDILQCGPTDYSIAASRPVVFWFFRYEPRVESRAVICTPNISISNAFVDMDLLSGNIKTITTNGSFVAGESPYSSSAYNVTGPPLNGAAYNGIGFNFSNPTEVDIARLNAIQLQLPAAIFRVSNDTLFDESAIYNSDAIVGITARVYTTYLALFAQTAYFVPNVESLTMKVTIVIKRLWVSTVAAHVLAVILILIAALGTIVQLAHRGERKKLFLTHPAGTIACAVSVGGSAQLGQLVARMAESDMQKQRQMGMNDDTVGGLGRRKSMFSPLMPRRGTFVRRESGEPKTA